MIVISYRLLNALKQDRPIERLCEVCDSPGLQNPFAKRSVRERGDENDRDVDTRVHKVFTKVGPAHPRHSHVSNETVRLSRPLRSQECFSRVESLDVVSEGFHET